MEVKYDGDLAFVDGYRFRKDKKSGYYLSSKKIGTSRIRLHRYMWEKYHGKIPKGFEVHHIDENKDNNEIENFELLTKKKHLLWHVENTPDDVRVKQLDNLEIAREKAVDWHKSEEGRQWHSKQARINSEKASYVTSVCKHCGKTFKEKEFGRKRKFCTPTCQTAFRVKSGVDNEIRECVVCGEKFSINRYRKTKTCSRSCASKLTHKTMRSSE